MAQTLFKAHPSACRGWVVYSIAILIILITLAGQMYLIGEADGRKQMKEIYESAKAKAQQHQKPTVAYKVCKNKDLRTGKIDVSVYHWNNGDIDETGFFYNLTEKQADSITKKYSNE